MKSKLQELDSYLISKHNLINEQNGRLLEKDKSIENNKTEIERLEKKSKMLEHKVGDECVIASSITVICRWVQFSRKPPAGLF